MKKLLTIIGGRKVFLTVIIFIFSLCLLLTNGLTEEDFTQIIKTLLIVYPASNVTQKLLITPDVVANNLAKLKNEGTNRKFIINLSVYLVITLLTGIGVLTSESYIGITSWLLTMYVAGNVSSKIKKV